MWDFYIDIWMTVIWRITPKNLKLTVFLTHHTIFAVQAIQVWVAVYKILTEVLKG